MNQTEYQKMFGSLVDLAKPLLDRAFGNEAEEPPQPVPVAKQEGNEGLQDPVSEADNAGSPYRRPKVQNVQQFGGAKHERYGYDIEAARAGVQRYIDAGYDPKFAIGMVANGVQESGLQPNAWNDSEGAFGIFQHRNDRLVNLREFANARELSLGDLNTHIDFSIEEFATTERGAYEYIQGGNPDTAAEYARLIDKKYERSAGTEREKRAKIAADMYQMFFGEGGDMTGVDLENPAVAAITGNSNDLQQGAAEAMAIEGTERLSTMEEIERFFVQGDNETDEQFRDRNKATWMALAEGFGGLSRGTGMDFTNAINFAGTRQVERDQNAIRQERNELRGREADLEERGLDIREQEVMRQGAQADARIGIARANSNLARDRFDYDRQVDAGDPTRSSEAAQAYAKASGIELSPELADSPQAAYEYVQEQLKNRRESPQLSEGARTAALAQAEAQGNTTAAALLNSNSAEEQRTGLKEVLDFKAPDQPMTPEQLQTRVDTAMQMLPSDITPEEEKQFRAAFETAYSSPSDTSINNVLDMVQERITRKTSSQNIANEFIPKAVEEMNDFMKGEAGLLLSIQEAQNIAANPDVTTNRLTSEVLAPLASWAQGVPGLEDLGDMLADGQDRRAAVILDSLKDRQLGNLGAQVVGALSNLEGDRLLAALPDAAQERMTIMAIAQIMEADLQNKGAAMRGRMNYLQMASEGKVQFNADELGEYNSQLMRGATNIFPDLQTKRQRYEMMAEALGYNPETDGGLKEFLQAKDADGSLENLPARDRARLVRMPTQNGTVLVPLFLERYDDLHAEYSRYGL